jgi:hypothetical protein
MRWVVRTGVERCHLDHRTWNRIKLLNRIKPALAPGRD